MDPLSRFKSGVLNRWAFPPCASGVNDDSRIDRLRTSGGEDSVLVCCRSGFDHRGPRCRLATMKIPVVEGRIALKDYEEILPRGARLPICHFAALTDRCGGRIDCRRVAKSNRNIDRIRHLLFIPRFLVGHWLSLQRKIKGLELISGISGSSGEGRRKGRRAPSSESRRRQEPFQSSRGRRLCGRTGC
jgi:hypothetical protein